MRINNFAPHLRPPPYSGLTTKKNNNLIHYGLSCYKNGISMERNKQHIPGRNLERRKHPAQGLPYIVLLIVRTGSEEGLVPAAVLLPYLGQNIRVGRSRAASFYCNIDEYGRIFGACR